MTEADSYIAGSVHPINDTALHSNPRGVSIFRHAQGQHHGNNQGYVCSFICMHRILMAETTFRKFSYRDIALGNGEIPLSVIDDLKDFLLSFANPPVFDSSFALELVESAAVDDDVVSAAQEVSQIDPCKVSAITADELKLPRQVDFFAL